MKDLSETEFRTRQITPAIGGLQGTKGQDASGKGLSIPEAFPAALLKMKDKYLNTYFWAGFVLVE